MATVHEMDHPLIKHKLSLMRDKTTGVKEFREAASEIAMLMCYEATRDLPLKEITIETPVSEARVQVISGKKIALVPILRAGLGMVEGILEMIPAAKVGHIADIGPLRMMPAIVNPMKKCWNGISSSRYTVNCIGTLCSFSQMYL